MGKKIVLVSDIHGNAPALKSVIEKEGTSAEYMVLGDLMGLNAYPQEVISLLQSLENATIIAGNHDKAIFHYNEGHVNNNELSTFEFQHTYNTLSENERQWMIDLPFMEIVQRGEYRICLTHAMPWPEKASGYERGNCGIQKKDVAHIASVVSDDYDYVFYGHTHEQSSIDCSKFGGHHNVTFVNPGTLGWKQEYAVFDTETTEVTFREVEYDDNIKKHVQNLLPNTAPHTDEWLDS